MTSGSPEARRAQCRVGSPVARPIPRGLLKQCASAENESWGSARAGRGHGELSVAECYVKPTTHAATEERLVSAVESIRGDFRELGRRLDWYFERLHARSRGRAECDDGPQDSDHIPAQNVGGRRYRALMLKAMGDMCRATRLAIMDAVVSRNFLKCAVARCASKAVASS
jgi:hypothetical protein